MATPRKPLDIQAVLDAIHGLVKAAPTKAGDQALFDAANRRLLASYAQVMLVAPPPDSFLVDLARGVDWNTDTDIIRGYGAMNIWIDPASPGGMSSTTLSNGTVYVAVDPARPGSDKSVLFQSLPGPWENKPAAPIPDDGVTLWGEISAWRAWRVQGLRLRSLYQPEIWEPGVPMVGDPETKGVHAFKTAYETFREVRDAEVYSRWNTVEQIAIGKVDLWGAVIEHERGYRAEFARVTAIDSVTGPDGEAIAAHLREAYGVGRA